MTATNGAEEAKAEAVVDVSIATQPNDLDAIPGLLKDITAGVGALSSGGDEARHELLIKARTMVQALESPRETMIKHCWGQTGALAGLNFGVDSGLWRLMVNNGDRPQKVGELAGSLGVDSVLLSRLMRHLGAMGYIKETGLDEYRPTNFSKSMSLPMIGDGYIAMTSCTGAAPLKFHEYSRKRGFKNPNDARDTALMYAYNTEMDMFAWQQHLGCECDGSAEAAKTLTIIDGTHFNHHMSGYRQGRVPWSAPSFYPVNERLIAGADQSPEAPFLVDIGGSIGHDIVEFHRMHPETPGKLILQDLPVVIGQIKELDPAVTPMSHDFLTEQPVKGARAYYMHSCLHDWPDDVCAKILAQIKGAMRPGYSRLLINENVIPSTGAYWETSALDMVMLTLFSSKERTENDWYNLLETIAGLKIVKIWSGGKGVESLIEVELP
ncbi:Sterigmatocystin 8-o-methyltransferase [Colletotrichum higginsianum IMI 349063]|uniref:Sterigmatocystin 8-o-methyltransferase n=1 Tax=Colletotrichum higginsianum (strain IMI 349063) TaxID=759273 RepID=A0A1B7YR60_COLHI|nr:Sterigmatocystin 8-o-methyltransferase [Colletotrichum higginsianum IMI 349063]OBR14526.1 Sterigmatocystin 8-o-methyltransferase [Colletotrichum higginsianum IMI 349063]